jgi:hypothetical protein
MEGSELATRIKERKLIFDKKYEIVGFNILTRQFETLYPDERHER